MLALLFTTRFQDVHHCLTIKISGLTCFSATLMSMPM
jgi:hypothetical protein